MALAPPLLCWPLLLLLAVLAAALVRSPRCTSSFGANRTLLVNCSRRSLASFGILEGDSLRGATQLLLSANAIDSFPVAHIAAQLPSLRHLDLSTNRITELSSTDVDWPSLRVLDLSANRLTHLSRLDLAFAQHLRHLNLSHNRIRTVASHAWLHAHRLRSLDLSANAIVFVTADWFWGLWRLEELRLAGNNIFHLFDRTFTHLRQLRRLDLSANRVRLIDSLAFAEQTDLDLLRLDDNHLSSFPEGPLASFQRIGVGDFSRNHFRTFGHDNRVAGVNISDLRFDGLDRLASVHTGAFARLPLTARLSVSGSPQLRYWSPRAVEACPALAELRLAGNGLVAVAVEHLQRLLPSLAVLDLSRNPLLCQCDLVRQVRRATAGPLRLRHLNATRCALPNDPLRQRLLLEANATCADQPLVIGAFERRMGVPEGHSLTLRCRSFPSAASGANVSVDWRLPQAVLKAQEARSRVKVEAPPGDLVLSDATPGLSGSYSCYAADSTPSSPDAAVSSILSVDVSVRPLRARLLLLDRRSNSLSLTWRQQSRLDVSNNDLMVLYRQEDKEHFQHLILRPFSREIVIPELEPLSAYLVCLAIRNGNNKGIGFHRLHCLHTTTTASRDYRTSGDWFKNGTFVVAIVAVLGVSLGLLVACLLYCNLHSSSSSKPHDSAASLVALESAASTPMAFENRAIVEAEMEAEYGSNHMSLREIVSPSASSSALAMASTSATATSAAASAAASASGQTTKLRKTSVVAEVEEEEEEEAEARPFVRAAADKPAASSAEGVPRGGSIETKVT